VNECTVDSHEMRCVCVCVCVCVMLRASGVAEQLQVDMSPKLQETQKLLGGGATFLGQWEDLEVILMVSEGSGAVM
jgi:hypothetical protein